MIHPQIVDPHIVDVDGKHYIAKNILISVGGDHLFQKFLEENM